MTNWRPLNRQDQESDIILRIYVPEIDKIPTWKVPVVEKIQDGIFTPQRKG